MQDTKNLWKYVVHVATHTLLGSLLFLFVGIPAVGLSVLVHLLQNMQIDGFTIGMLIFLERAILIADAGLFLTCLVFAVVQFVKEVFNELQRHCKRVQICPP